jgi:hypothetical protein
MVTDLPVDYRQEGKKLIPINLLNRKLDVVA